MNGFAALPTNRIGPCLKSCSLQLSSMSIVSERRLENDRLSKRQRSIAGRRIRSSKSLLLQDGILRSEAHVVENPAGPRHGNRLPDGWASLGGVRRSERAPQEEGKACEVGSAGKPTEEHVRAEGTGRRWVTNYTEFLEQKAQLGSQSGFKPLWIPDFLFDFQKHLVEWAILKGRGAIFADCGLGKTPMQLVWAENVVRHRNKPVLILTPLAVAAQTEQEAEKFGIYVSRPHGPMASASRGIIVTNYERLHYYNPCDFVGAVCDESSILKSFDGVRRKEITEFMRKLPYRLLCTATAAPNDYIELGTSSEALGELGYTDMLTRFFKNDQHTIRPMVYRNKGNNFAQLDENAKWRFKGHAEIPFWRWVCSWARACRKPSDLGFADDKFLLPSLIESQYMVDANTTAPGFLFSLPAVGLTEQREERRRTVTERCEKIASMVNGTGEPALIWCHLNVEGDLLEKIIPDAEQVSGNDSDESKEEKFLGFAAGKVRVLITKPKIGAWGLNFQHCAHVLSFPSHSFEQYYQGVRRCWRFGQKRAVHSDIVTTEGEKTVLENLQKKSKAADVMFSNLVNEMNSALRVDPSTYFSDKAVIPSWL
jgi:hypothetical protein